MVPVTRLKAATDRAPYLATDTAANTDDTINTALEPTDTSTTSNNALPDGYYLIDHLMDRKRIGRGYSYKVRWAGYSAADDTWQSRSTLPRNVVDDYDRQHPLK